MLPPHKEKIIIQQMTQQFLNLKTLNTAVTIRSLPPERPRGLASPCTRQTQYLKNQVSGTTSKEKPVSMEKRWPRGGTWGLGSGALRHQGVCLQLPGGHMPDPWPGAALPVCKPPAGDEEPLLETPLVFAQCWTLLLGVKSEVGPELRGPRKNPRLGTSLLPNALYSERSPLSRPHVNRTLWLLPKRPPKSLYQPRQQAWRPPATLPEVVT